MKVCLLLLKIFRFQNLNALRVKLLDAGEQAKHFFGDFKSFEFSETTEVGSFLVLNFYSSCFSLCRLPFTVFLNCSPFFLSSFAMKRSLLKMLI